MTRTSTAMLVVATAVALVATAAVAQPMWGGGRGGPGGGPLTMFDTFDANDDGRVTQQEIDTVRAERLAAFDRNGDGVLDLEEYQALWADAMRQPMIRRFQMLDANADGQVTGEEFQAPFARALARFDTEEEGVLTQDDLRNMRRDRWERRGDGYGRGRPGPMGDGSQFGMQ